MEVGEVGHVEVTGTVEPFLVLFGGEGAHEALAARLVGEDADDERAALEFLVEAFEEVGALAVFVVGVREAPVRLVWSLDTWISEAIGGPKARIHHPRASHREP